MLKIVQTWQALLIVIILLTGFVLFGSAVIAVGFLRINPQIPQPSFKLEIASLELDFFITPTSFLTSTPSLSLFTPTASLTPFQPISPTETPTITPTPTETPLPTPTWTFTPESTPQPSITLKPSEIQSVDNTLPTPTEDGLPSEVQITGVPGHSMRFSLDCETRSAVDLAAFFGVTISHVDFLDRLPNTDDPETGYVGSYRDQSGSIPPYSYGVHAAPIAALLREFGVNASDHKGLNFEMIKKEIAAGHPVMVWVIGSVQFGTPVEYTAASTGNTTTVAAYEHTVLVTGYSDYQVTIQDGWDKYYRTIRQFQASWSVLGNMAVTVE